MENSKFDAFLVFAFGGERTGILTTIEKLHFGFGDSEREIQKLKLVLCRLIFAV